MESNRNISDKIVVNNALTNGPITKISKTSIDKVLPRNKVPKDVSPSDYLIQEIRQRIHGDIIMHRATEIVGFFREPTEEDFTSYNNTAVSAIRSRNIEKLRELYKNGTSLQSCNRFGESLVHMACRRGFTDVVEFLITEASISVNIRDDFGRTPLHDACWTSQPNLALVDTLIRKEPRLLLMSDKRGYTPFQYARKEHWDIWRRFLSERISEICDIKESSFLDWHTSHVTR